MDRNSIIGVILLVLMGAGFFWYSNNESQKLMEEQRIQDSIAAAQNPPPPAPTTTSEVTNDSSTTIVDSLAPNAFKNIPEELVVLSNEFISVTFNTKGARPSEIKFNQHKTYSGEDLIFSKGDINVFNIVIPYDGSTIQTQDLHFTPSVQEVNGAKQITLTAELANNKKIQFAYTLAPGSYMIQTQLSFIGMKNDLASLSEIPMSWTTQALPTEKDVKNERLHTQIHYQFSDGEHDYFTLQNTSSKEIETSLKWMSFKTHFFNSTLIADDKFTKTSFDASIDKEDSTQILTNKSKLSFPFTSSDNIVLQYKWMLSPNDYSLLKSHDMGFEDMIQLGFGIFFFVKYISKWLIIPLFTFLVDNVASVGISIILLTLIIRIFLSFFTYKSYLSSAKMRVLKPELDKLRERLGDDQQAMGMEQMKLYRTAGVNPLGGCLPMLLQMPFLLSMYYFFPTSLDLRQSGFLWAEDLSAYDSFITWQGDIPVLGWIFGNHISLFTVLMALTSLLIAFYNRNMNSMAPTGGGGAAEMNMKMLKWMPFIMPLLFLGWFNNFASGLTFYYTVSNILSLLQQIIIQKLFIDEKKILAKIEQKRKEPAKTSKWQQRLEEMQKMQAERMKQGKK